MADGNGGGGNGGSWHVWVGLIIALIAAGGGYVAWEQRFFSQKGDDAEDNFLGTQKKNLINKKDMAIYAAQDWQSTGIRLGAGDHISILVTGEIRIGNRKTAPGRGLCGPKGVPPVSAPRGGDSNDFRKYSIVPGWNHGSVIAKVGETLIPVGQETVFVSSDDGMLELRINDIDTDNNSGKFSAEITHEAVSE